MRPPLAQTGVLLTRLLSPRLPPDCLERPALVERVVEGTRRRLVTVLAGAGYGKSTLIAQALGRVEPTSVWISCDERLGGSADLLAHIAAGIERSVPGFGAQLALEGCAASWGPVSSETRGLYQLILEDKPLPRREVAAAG